MKLDVKVASLDALDAVRSKRARICPLTCNHGYKPNDERCVKITCKAGFFLNDDNDCEKKHDKSIARRESTPEAAHRASTPTVHIQRSKEACDNVVYGHNFCTQP
jgi:hypothetical protein